jgi:hypothetical protein
MYWPVPRCPFQPLQPPRNMFRGRNLSAPVAHQCSSACHNPIQNVVEYRRDRKPNVTM